MKIINKIGFIFVFCCILFIAGCKDPIKMITKIEIVEHPLYSYNAGDEIRDFKVTGGKIEIIYDDGTKETKNIEGTWLGDIEYATGKILVKYEGKETEATVSNINYVDTNEKLLATQSYDNKIVVIKAGSYEVEALRYEKDIILIGDGVVNIKLTGASSNQAAVLCLSNVSIKDLNFTTEYTTTLISCLKIGKIEVDGDVPLINKAYLENVKLTGGKGLNITAVSSVTIDNIEINVNEDTKNVAMSLSSGSNVKLENSKISHGSWGSIAIFGVDSESTQEWYKRKSTLEIKDSEISSAVYIEHFAVNNSTVSGLDGWAMAELTNTRVYTKEALE